MKKCKMYGFPIAENNDFVFDKKSIATLIDCTDLLDLPFEEFANSLSSDSSKDEILTNACMLLRKTTEIIFSLDFVKIIFE